MAVRDNELIAHANAEYAVRGECYVGCLESYAVLVAVGCCQIADAVIEMG